MKPKEKRQLLKKLSAPDWRRTSGYLLMDYGIILLLGIACEYLLSIDPVYGWAGYLFSLPFIGGRILGINDTIGHELIHFNGAKRKNINRVMGYLCFLPVFDTFERYRTNHWDHHRFLGMENDPSQEWFRDLGLTNRKNLRFKWFVRPFTGYFTWEYMVSVIKNFLSEGRQHRIQLIVFWSMVTVFVLLTGTTGFLIKYWMIPLLFIYPVFMYWREAIDHFGLAPGKLTRDLKGNFWTRIFIAPHSDGYHHLHHKYPNIPLYNLKRGYVLMNEEDMNEIQDCSGFFDAYRSFQTTKVAYHND